MNKDIAIQQLKEQQQNADVEMAHLLADEILCSLLNNLGFKDVVEEYEKIEKWYA